MDTSRQEEELIYHATCMVGSEKATKSGFILLLVVLLSMLVFPVSAEQFVVQVAGIGLLMYTLHGYYLCVYHKRRAVAALLSLLEGRDEL